MPTRTAPDPSTDPVTEGRYTLSLIDASGDLNTISVPGSAVPNVTDAQDFATKFQAATNMSLYKISLTSEWSGDADPDNATAAFRGSASDGINLLYRLGTVASTYRLFAPIAAVMQGNQDIPLFTASELSALILDIASLTGAEFESGQYTERRERKNNPRIRA